MDPESIRFLQKSFTFVQVLLTKHGSFFRTSIITAFPGKVFCSMSFEKCVSTACCSASFQALRPPGIMKSIVNRNHICTNPIGIKQLFEHE
jgi:hypothetical protein